MADTVKDYRQLSIRDFKKRGCLKQGQFAKGRINYSRGGEKIGTMQYVVSLSEEVSYIRMIFRIKPYGEDTRKSLDYKIQLSKTPCTFGGFRYWFLCPCTGRRCAKLYLQSNGIFCDRKAMKLSYPVQLMSHHSRKLEPPMYQWELDRLYASIKVFYRSGKPTRKYQRYIKNSSKLTRVFKVMVGNDIKRIQKWGLGYLL